MAAEGPYSHTAPAARVSAAPPTETELTVAHARTRTHYEVSFDESSRTAPADLLGWEKKREKKGGQKAIPRPEV